MRIVKRSSAEAGQATILLMLMIVVAMIALTVLFVRIGHADFMRSNAKEAADASALAAASAVRDRAISSLQAEAIPGPLFPDDSSRRAASEYAKLNNAEMTGYESGMFTSDVKVTVASSDCVYKNQQPYKPEKPCPQNPSDQTKKQLKRATASSVATVEFPSCAQVFDRFGHFLYLTCDGQSISGLSRAQLAGFFNVHLKDTFNKGTLAGFGPGGVSNLPPPTKGHAPQNMKMAKDMLAQNGWGPEEFDCLLQLWTHESGWNERATNPSSKAYGIPQALPASKMGSTALSGNWPADAKAQITWGLDYISGRYTTPCGAWAFWQHPANSPPGSSVHWY
ncbi:MAG TPA: pilus assembly protein TadG-related protein [Streptosporangiaceae bacterium]|jgi:hypothetical protein